MESSLLGLSSLGKKLDAEMPKQADIACAIDAAADLFCEGQGARRKTPMRRFML
jgi:hypothetical protein